jgi:hypothetical protein
MLEAKIYGLCLERLKYQIGNAKERTAEKDIHEYRNGFLLESYNTGDIDDIIDILELYDLEERTLERLREKLGDLAYTVSLLMRERLFFDFTREGHLGLYLSVNDAAAGKEEGLICQAVSSLA